ncbi:hypothetical protein GYMLUDRAFT_176943, partial [Collybiopsis luxurians FD-317 M1]
KWSGQAHGLLLEFPHCTPGSIIHTCFSCPEDGFNMEEGWERTLEELKYVFALSELSRHNLIIPFVRHLNQDQRMLDGNFHIGQYIKNTDPNDISLVMDNGIGYFPNQNEASEYLAKMPNIAEVHTCPYSFFSKLMSPSEIYV